MADPLKWLPIILISVACMLAVYLDQQLPWLARLGAIGIVGLFGFGLWGFNAFLVRLAEKRVITRVGVKWDWVLFPVYVLVSLNYIMLLVSKSDVSTFRSFSAFLVRFLIFGLGCAFTTLGIKMARDIRLKPASEMGTEEHNGKNFDWHRDVARYQVPLVLFALGLSLFQMI